MAHVFVTIDESYTKAQPKGVNFHYCLWKQRLPITSWDQIHSGSNQLFPSAPYHIPPWEKQSKFIPCAFQRWHTLSRYSRVGGFWQLVCLGKLLPVFTRVFVKMQRWHIWCTRTIDFNSHSLILARISRPWIWKKYMCMFSWSQKKKSVFVNGWKSKWMGLSNRTNMDGYIEEVLLL